MAARGKATGRRFLEAKEDQMAHGGIGRSVDVRGAVLVALLCIATLLGAGCSTTSGPSESGDYTDAPPGMVRVPSGSFVMGDGGALCGADEHEVTLTRDFYLGQHEVTNQEYLEAVQWAYDNGYVTTATWSVQDNLDGSTEELLNLYGSNCEIEFDGVSTFLLRDAGHGINPDHPVKEVTWYGAVRYCDWLSLQEDPPLDRAYEHSGDWLCNNHDPYGAEGYRLPTDAEWEYAAQYEDERIYPWGNAPPTCDLANYEDCVDWTSPVESCPAGNSALGLSDMAGNVWELCSDWYVCDLGEDATTDPTGEQTGLYRVLRGGTWNGNTHRLRCAARSKCSPGATASSLGFRAARTVNP
jgi:formylglycine-generating enzyme required for sulfatase activity